MRFTPLASLLLAVTLLSTFPTLTNCRYKKYQIPLHKARKNRINYITKFHIKEGARIYVGGARLPASIDDPDKTFEIKFLIFTEAQHRAFKRTSNGMHCETRIEGRQDFGYINLSNNGTRQE